MGSSPHTAPRDQVGPALARFRVRAAELRPGLEGSLAKARVRAAELRPGIEESLWKARARAADLRPSFDEVVRRTFAMSTRVASRIVGDAEAVSDVLQDAYLNVYRSLERFRGASRYETWVYRIVVNAARSHMRRVRRLRERETSLDQRQEEPLVAGVESCPTDRVHERIDVISLLARLSESDRELLTLRYLAGMTIQQVAAELGASEGAVKVRLHRARKRLLALVNEDLAEEQVGTGAPFGEKW